MSPQEYDELERKAVVALPNRIIEASQTLAFRAVGYPTRISSEAELWRYADVMQEDRLKPTFDAIGGLTEHELGLVRKITAQVWVDIGVYPGSALIRAIPVYRAIREKYPHGCTVFELGAGSAYVGALLMADGYRYRTSDVCQAFALWQMKLLGENAVVPWWEWMTDWFEAVGVFTANHMLNEMHPNALLFMIHKAKKMLGETGVFLVEDFGSTVIRSTQDTIDAFTQRGLQPIQVLASTEKHPIGWDKMLEFWDGQPPQSADEKFLAGLR